MAASRSRRSTAGNKMASLLDSEEVDDFYTTTYGGFSEEAEDKEYIVEPTESKRQRYLFALLHFQAETFVKSLDVCR